MDGEEVETSSSPGPFLICEHMILISAISKPVKMTKNIQKVICTEDVLSWEIPQYFYQAIQCMLAHQMSLILPAVDIPRIQYLEGQADKYFNMAESENRDKSPIYYAPNISVYTR